MHEDSMLHAEKEHLTMHLTSKESKMLFSLFRLVLKTEGGIQNVVHS